jgi:hypothetical protein
MRRRVSSCGAFCISPQVDLTCESSCLAIHSPTELASGSHDADEQAVFPRSTTRQKSHYASRRRVGSEDVQVRKRIYGARESDAMRKMPREESKTEMNIACGSNPAGSLVSRRTSARCRLYSFRPHQSSRPHRFLCNISSPGPAVTCSLELAAADRPVSNDRKDCIPEIANNVFEWTPMCR